MVTPEPPDAVVVMVVLMPLGLENANPPKPPFEILVIATVASLVLVKVHAMFEPAAVAAASSVIVFPDKVAVPEPMPVQVAPASVKPAVGASVIVAPALVAVSVWVGPEVPAPPSAVVTKVVPTPLLPVKVKLPVPPFEILMIRTVGVALAVLVIVQTTLACPPVLPGLTVKDPLDEGTDPLVLVEQLVVVV